MGKRWGIALATLTAFASLATACSSTSSSEGVVSTTASAEEETTAPAATDATDSTEATDETAAETSAPAAPTGGTVTVGLDDEPPTLDPAANSLSLANGSVYSAIYDTLFTFTPENPVPVPLLADSLTEAPDRLSWTLTLKDGITFHDGTPFDAEAVKFNLERQKLSPFNGSSLIPLTAVEVVDPLTLTLRLSEPWTALSSALSGIVGVMVSPTAAADTANFSRNPVGTGPFKFVEWVPSDNVTVERNEDYWGDQPPSDGLVFKFIPVEAARVAAFEAGELDAMVSGIDRTAEEAEADGAQVATPPPSGYVFTYINEAKAPLNDPRVRHALEIGYDRDAIAEAYQGQGYADASFSPFVKDTEWWAAPAEPSSFDPDGARALLAEYGQPVGFTFKVLGGNQELEDYMRAIVEYWNDIGVDAELQLIPDIGTYVTDIITGNYDMIAAVGGSTGDPDLLTYNLFHTGGATNYGGYTSPEMDAALEQGRHADVDEERHAAYDTVQQIIRDDLPILFMWHGSLYHIGSPDVSGLDANFFFPVRTIAVAG